MLGARGQRSIGSAHLSWALVFASRVWSVAVERTGLVLDTRFMPAATHAPRPRSCVYFLLRGSWIVHEPKPERLVAPRAFLVTESQLEGHGGRRSFFYSAGGDPFQAVEVHVRDADLRIAAGSGPVPIDVPDDVLGAAGEVVLAAGRDDAALEGAFGALLGGLARAGVLDAAAVEQALRPPPRPLAIIWSTVRPMVERWNLNPTLQELEGVSGVSTRQLARRVTQFVNMFGLVGTRWRASTLHVRLKLAVILLSADDVSVGDVARAVGYGSADAMARSFRDAGMPPPATVQRAVREARTALVADP
jgi:AraC-like DNA-binding protein